jgi:CspA family cold shock protein
MNGSIKFFNDGKGYGFVSADDGKEYFVHVSGLAEGLTVKEGDAVTFDVEDGERGPKAVNVQLGSADAAPAAEESAEDEE